MKLREFKGLSKGLYQIYYRFHNGSEHLSTICHHIGFSSHDLYSNVDPSSGSLVDISLHGNSIYNRHLEDHHMKRQSIHPNQLDDINYLVDRKEVPLH